MPSKEGETGDIFELLESSTDTEFPELFIEKLVPVLKHAKDEICEFLCSKSIPVLKKLRPCI